MNRWIFGKGIVLRICLMLVLALPLIFGPLGTQPGRAEAAINTEETLGGTYTYDAAVMLIAPALGTYPATNVVMGGNTTVAPSAAPTDTTSLNVSTDTNFKGTLAADPATGVIRVTNAHPAGIYSVMVQAFGAGGSTSKTFSLTVNTGVACTTAPVFTAPPDVGVGSEPDSIAVGDFNNDGKQDLAAVNYVSNTVSIRLGDGAGSFSGTTDVTVASYPTSMAVGDFNNDGNQDLAVANGFSNNVSIRLGDGTGGFSGTTNVGVASYPYSVVVGDFNNDDKQDFAAVNYGSNTVSIRLGNGDGTFTSPIIPEIGVGSHPMSAAVGDFNNDGKQDFAAVNYVSNTVSIRLGDGTGGFSGTTEIGVGSFPMSVAVGDFNNDGKQDLAVANDMSSTVSIRLGDGLGGFSGTTEVSVGNNPTSVAVGDFNNDGKQDLAVANNALSGTVSIRLGDGLGSLSGTTNVGVASYPYFVAVGDFNNDGKQDLAIAHNHSGSVSIRLGNLPVCYAGNGNTGGSAPTSITYTPGATVTVSGAGTLVKTGYTFSGWNTAADGSGIVYTPATTFSITVPTILYAQWRAIDYTVTYDGNGYDSGTVPTDNNPYNIGDTVHVLFTPQPSLTGYIFAGWSDGVTTYTSGGTTSFTMGSSNITLTAQWACSPYSVVGSSADSGAGSLRQEIAGLCPGGTITFNGDYTILLSSELAIGKDMTIDGSGHTVTVSGNHVTRVFHLTGGTISLIRLTIANGYFVDGSYSGASGAGIYVDGASLNVSNSTFSGNTSGWPGGGGIQIYFGSTANVVNSAFIGNSAVSGGYGGGIDSMPSTTLNVTNSTFSGNSAASAGGGLSVSGAATILNSTISGNSSGWTGGGGGINNEAGSVVVKNSLLANNPTGGNCFNHYGSSYLFTGSTSLVDDGSCDVAGIAGFTQSSSILLGTLGNFGGTTPTFALLPGSSAIDAGDDTICNTAPVSGTDQRGVAHAQGAHCDTGAFESRGFSLTKSNGDGQSTAVNAPFTNPLEVTVSNAFSEPVNGGQVTFTSPGSGASAYFSADPVVLSDGSASTTATANGVAGSYSVTANARGVTASVDFALTNLDTYTVSYNANNATGGTAPGNQAKIQGVSLTLATNTGSLVKTGYTLTGWNTASNGSGTHYALGGTYTTNAAVSLYAEWTANTYTITFDSVGGTAVARITQAYGSAVTAPSDPTKAGYTFAGWDPEIPSTMPLGGAALTAQWTANTYTLTFDGNGGGTPNPTSKLVTYASAYGTLATISRTGYTFEGWYTAPTDGTEITDTTIVSTASNHTLYGHWMIDTYAVTYNGNGNTDGTAPSDQTKTYGVDLTLATNLGGLVKTGYTFSGWNTLPNGTGTHYGAGGTYSANAPVSLYAEWRINQYTISFEEKGGSTVNDITTDYGASVSAPPDPTRTGYTFGGWYTDDGTFLNVYTFSTMPAANVSLYAKWTANTYTVNFNGNGGSIPNPVSKQVAYGSAYGALATVSRTGYTFDGWYDAATGGNAVTDVTVVSTASNHTLYAHWTVNTYYLYLPLVLRQ